MSVSVVICTRNRADDLEGSIRAINAAAAAVPQYPVRLIVVDNGSTDETQAELKRLAALLDLEILVIFEARAGLSRARNAGLRQVSEGLIILTDDDCHLSVEYIKNAMEANDRDKETLTLRGGRVLLGDSRDLPVTIKTDELASIWTRANNDASRCNLGDSLLGANMCFRKSLADKVGFFDERLGAGASIPGGEDIDYVFRCYQAGAQISYEPALTVHHYHGRREISQARLLMQNYSIGGGALVAKYGLKSPTLVKQFRWDLKDSLKEAFTGKDTFHPDIGFSSRDKLKWQIVGIVRFMRLILSGQPAYSNC